MDHSEIGNLDLRGSTHAVRTAALELGFDLCRIVPVGAPLHGDFFARWLALGRAGEMRYLERFVDRRLQPALLGDRGMVLRSMVVVAVDYSRIELDPGIVDDPSRGVIARFAWTADYHDVLRPALYDLDRLIAGISGRSERGKALVDTGPVLERDWALASGLGFTGKNCCTIHPVLGSWLLLGTLMVPEIFEYDRMMADPVELDAAALAAGCAPGVRAGRWEIPLAEGSAVGTCGGCSRCIKACPTDAFVGPFHLDPAACISYWTIESRQPIPRQLRPRFGNRIFGCDICQEVCPWNRKRRLGVPAPAVSSACADQVAPPLLEGFASASPYWLDDEAFRHRFAGSPLLRPGRVGMLRNVCVALGNWGDAAVVDALRLALLDPDPLPRGHAAWALGRVAAGGVAAARAHLEWALARESVDWVRDEIISALAD